MVYNTAETEIRCSETPEQRCARVRKAVQELHYAWSRSVENAFPPDRRTWGDELEHMLLTTSGKEVSLSSVSLLPVLRDSSVHGVWSEEYAKWMVESKPVEPYQGFSWRAVHQSIVARGRELSAQSTLCSPFNLSSFPFVGVSRCEPGPVTKSVMVQDDCLFPNERFSCLARAIRKRRGSTVHIRVPLERGGTLAGDAMAFGMGCCCLQVTVAAMDWKEAASLYDTFAVLAPLFLALTAATPFFRGHVADSDTRWGILSESVDDRPDREIARSRSRCSSIACYACTDHHDDVAYESDTSVFVALEEGGLPVELCKVFSNLLSNPALLDVGASGSEFLNVQSTVWSTVRLKPPNDEVRGFSVEFRPMEVQLSDDDNASFALLAVVLACAIVHYDIDIRIPISELDQNMTTAIARDAATHARFAYWRGGRRYLHEIIDESGFPDLIMKYGTDVCHLEGEDVTNLQRSVARLRARAFGYSMTPAAIMRAGVRATDSKIDRASFARFARSHATCG
jgi:glutamate--cysteine ligase catalytic subunit